MVPDAVDPNGIRRALVVKLRHHGDVLLSSPVFTALARFAPQAEIDALVYDDTAEMLALHPSIARVFTIGRKWRELDFVRRAAAEWALFADLRDRRHDLVVHLTDHPRGAWLARFLGARWSVAPTRPERWWTRSFTHRYPVVPAGRRHTVETNLDALRRLGIQPGTPDRRLVLAPGESAVAHVDRLLAELGVPAGQFIQVHPASRWKFKCWTESANVEMIDALADAGHPVVVTGAPSADEHALVAGILSSCRSRPIDLSGKLSLKQLAALTARARLFVGVDSAPMHIAAAMGTPVVALFGPSGNLEWGPWMVPARVVVESAFTCRPCGLDGCGGGKVSECLATLPSSRVLAAIDELLAATASR